jgi:hypothetical protein
MYSTVLKEIIAFIFGRKYYANIINTRGTSKCEICSYIFCTKEEAEKHRVEVDGTMSYSYIETLSFRSRKLYGAVPVKVKRHRQELNVFLL